MVQHPDHRSKRDRAIFKDLILKRYLPVLFNALTKCHMLIYLDAFSGPGIYEDGSMGSPLLAINTLVEFAKRVNISKQKELIARVIFRFLEQDIEYFENLNSSITKLLSNLKKDGFNLDVECFCEDAVRALKEGIQALHKIDDTHPIAIFVYLDPWGLKGIETDIVLEFLKLRNIKGYPVELLLRFPPYLVVRFYKNSSMGPDWIKKILGLNPDELEEILSNEEKEERWENVLKNYLSTIKKIYDSETGGNLYYTAIETLGSGQFYYMIFFTEHSYGLLKMNDSMTRTFAERDIDFRLTNQPLFTDSCRNKRGNFQFINKYIPKYSMDHPRYFIVQDEELHKYKGVPSLEELVAKLTLDRFFAINPDVVKRKLRGLIDKERIGKTKAGVTPILWP